MLRVDPLDVVREPLPSEPLPEPAHVPLVLRHGVPGPAVGLQLDQKAFEGGGYTDADGNHKYYSSFAGYFPAEDPQVTVLISIDEPPGAEGQETRFGGTAAAPVFARIAPSIIHEMDIQLPEGGGCPKG